MSNLLTNVTWSNPTTIGIVVATIVVVAVTGYFVWAWSKKKPPFNK